jgi:hypothetical protein
VDDRDLLVAVEADVSHVWVRVRGVTAAGQRVVYNADPTLWQFAPHARRAGWGERDAPPCELRFVERTRRRELLRHIDSRDAVCAAVIGRIVAASV